VLADLGLAAPESGRARGSSLARAVSWVGAPMGSLRRH
jgi:hypothetical protein